MTWSPGSTPRWLLLVGWVQRTGRGHRFRAQPLPRPPPRRSWRSSAPTPVSTSTCRFGNKVHEHPSWLSGWRRPVDAHRSGGLRADRQHRVTVEYLLRPECVVAVGVGDGPDDLPVD